MESSFSPKDEIWFLRVCHHISTGVYPIYTMVTAPTTAKVCPGNFRRRLPRVSLALWVFCGFLTTWWGFLLWSRVVMFVARTFGRKGETPHERFLPPFERRVCIGSALFNATIWRTLNLSYLVSFQWSSFSGVVLHRNGNSQICLDHLVFNFVCGDSSQLIEALSYKPEDRGFDSR